MRGDLRLLRLIEQARALAIDPRDQLARIPDPQLPAGVERPRERIGDLFGTRRIQAAVAPHDGHRWPVAPGGERVRDPRARGRGLTEELRRLGFDAGRIPEV